MQIAISGSTGLIGSAVVAQLSREGHHVRRLVRSQPKNSDDIRWDPAGPLPPADLSGCEAVIHLAGESIAARRWTNAQKQRIMSSRVEGTRYLADSILAARPLPKVWVCASAIGFYGDRGDETVDEMSQPGDGFLAEVCRHWEAATQSVAAAGVRVVNARFGIVLSPQGGALRQMLPPFRFGLGGRIGSGRQWMSWIALDDVVGAIVHALQTESLGGPVNCVAPQPVSNEEFTRTLGRVLGRPTIFPLPAMVVRTIFGEMGKELLLAGARVEPTRLTASSYRFQFPELEPALEHLLKA